MKRLIIFFIGMLLGLAVSVAGQAREVTYIADTLVVQAEGFYEADPDLATLRFEISVQEKELPRAYERAAAALQRILQLAERNGLTKPDIISGPLAVQPLYDSDDRKRRPRGYRVESTVILRLRDFGKIGALIDESVESGIVEFRSLNYSLADEEAAKQRAVATARQNAEGRARAALSPGQKLGVLRYVTVDVKEPVTIARERVGGLSAYSFVGLATESVSYSGRRQMPVEASSPQKVRINAEVHCIYQIQ